MDISIPKKAKSLPNKLVKPISPLTRPKKDELEPWGYTFCICNKSPGDSSSAKYVIKIPRFGSGTPEERIIFKELVHKSLVGQNVTTDPPMYECMERVLKVTPKLYFISRIT